MRRPNIFVNNRMFYNLDGYIASSGVCAPCRAKPLAYPVLKSLDPIRKLRSIPTEHPWLLGANHECVHLGGLRVPRNVYSCFSWLFQFFFSTYKSKSFYHHFPMWPIPQVSQLFSEFQNSPPIPIVRFVTATRKKHSKINASHFTAYKHFGPRYALSTLF